MSTIILEELVGGTNKPRVSVVQVEQPQVNAEPITYNVPMLHRSGRVVQ